DGEMAGVFRPLWHTFGPVRVQDPPLAREAVVPLPVQAQGVRVQVADGAGRLYRFAARLGELPAGPGWAALVQVAHDCGLGGPGRRGRGEEARGAAVLEIRGVRKGFGRVQA